MMRNEKDPASTINPSTSGEGLATELTFCLMLSVQINSVPGVLMKTDTVFEVNNKNHYL